jgi:transposase
MSRFPTPEHLASWAGVAPGTRESAGQRYPVRPPHVNKWLTAMLVEAAGSVGRMKGANYLAAQHARLTSRRGMARAQVAVGPVTSSVSQSGIASTPAASSWCRSLARRPAAARSRCG